MTKKIAIFASGSGTNAENIIRYFKGSSSVEVVLILSNRRDAFVLERAKEQNVPSAVFTKSDFEDPDKIVALLKDYQVDFIVLAGFLLKIPDVFLSVYPNKIINIHPALLPKFGGKGMYGDKVHEAVVAAGETESGITIHYIDENYDEGGIVSQIACPVLPEDTPEIVAAKVHRLEYEYYPQVIEKLVLKEE